jgi:hypothetical protein
MAYCIIAYLANTYDIPLSLDQTDIHLVPITKKYTSQSRGSKHIHVLGIEDKRHVTMAITSYVVEVLLPPQIIFTSTKSKQPKNNNVCNKWVGFDLW